MKDRSRYFSPIPRAVVTRYLRGYLLRAGLPFSISLALLLIVAALTAAKAWIIQPVVDTFLTGNTTHTDLYRLCGIVAGIFAVQAILGWLYEIVSRTASGKVCYWLRQDLYGKLTRQSLGYFTARPSAELASRVVNDVHAFEMPAVNAIQNLMRDSATVVLLLTVLILKNWRLAGTSLVLIVIVGLLLRWSSRRLEVQFRTVQDLVGQISRQLGEMVGGIDLLLGFGIGAEWEERFDRVNRKHYESQMTARRTASLSVMLVSLTVAGGICLLLMVTGRALLAGEITAGDFGTFLASLYLMQAPAVHISQSLEKLNRGLAAAGRALEILEEPIALEDPVEPTPLPDVPLEVAFEEVEFSYRGDRTIDTLSFSVPAGEIVAMVGDSGAGKSTVAKLLMRFYDPDAGRITLGGVALNELARRDLYHAVSYVPQEIFLFDGTIELNLRVGQSNASDAEIDEALRIACLSDFVAQLPDGLATHVGERGTQLSGGQRQRIAIARAILSDASILILDEATSAVDMELEQNILQNLVNARRRRTIFAVTHRLSIADIADRVLVLRHGKLAELGTAAELSRAGGEFARLQRAAAATLVRPDVSDEEAVSAF